MTARLVIVTVGIAVVLLLIGTVLSTDQISAGQVPWPLIVSVVVAFLFVLALAVPFIPLSESSSIEIGVTPERLWDALHELSNRAAWYPEVRRVAVTRSGPGLAKQQVSLGLSRGAVLKVSPIESVAPERMVSRITGPGIRSVLTQELAPITGGTLYTTSDNLRVSIIAALVRAAGGRRFKARRAARMERIKHDVEAASG